MENVRKSVFVVGLMLFISEYKISTGKNMIRYKIALKSTKKRRISKFGFVVIQD